MLPKKERLSRAEFNRFFSVGKKTHSPSLLLVFAPHPTLHASVVVPKKIIKSAVKRNAMRRRIYDIVRNYKSERGVVGTFIFFVRAPAAVLTYEALKHEVCSRIEEALKKFDRKQLVTKARNT